MRFQLAPPARGVLAHEIRLRSWLVEVLKVGAGMPVIEGGKRWRLRRRSAKLVSGPPRPAIQPMWKAIQDFLGPVPAPVFILIFVAGLALSIIASAPTKWVEKGLSVLAGRRSKRKPLRTPKAKS